MKNLKTICGLALTCLVFALSLLIVNSATAADTTTKVQINGGTIAVCEASGSLINFGATGTSDTSITLSQTIPVNHRYTISSGAKCTITAQKLVRSGDTQSIEETNFKFSTTVITRAGGTDGGNLNTTSKLNETAYSTTALVLYDKGRNEAGKGTQTLTAKLTIPAWTPSGTYNGKVTITATAY